MTTEFLHPTRAKQLAPRGNVALRNLARPRPVAAALLAAEFACRAAGAVEDDLVRTVIIEVDEVSLPSLRARRRALLTFDADKHGRHSEDDRAGRRSRLVAIADTAEAPSLRRDRSDWARGTVAQPAGAAPKTLL